MGSQRPVKLYTGTEKEPLSSKTATVNMSGQDGCWEQFDATCSLISAPNGIIYPQWTVMDFHGQINAACESRPGYPQLCHWSVWIVLECGFHVKLQNGFQFLQHYAGFWQIQSHMQSLIIIITHVLVKK